MSYGLQIRNAAGDIILDTDERFTRVYSSYPNNIITGTRQGTSSKYAFMSTFTITVPVVLPPTIQNWTPLITSATSQWISSNIHYASGRQVDGIAYAAVELNLNINADVVQALTGGQKYVWDYYSNYPTPTEIDYKPNVIAEAVFGVSPYVRLHYRYLASITRSSDSTLYASERQATVSFVIVGY
jgi:hypothetical protein